MRDDIAPLKTMSYFSNGSMVRQYREPMDPRSCFGPSQVSFAVHVYFHAMWMSSFLGSPPMSKRAAAKFSPPIDRKSTRLNSSHRCISYAVFCLKKKIKQQSST